ncbi:MAG: hypothetical protein PHC46_03845 [Clostridia bacterium]|nr:hypothetical protein [Clostridia bacterium]
MSTRSLITIENEDGTYRAIYCHCDGYLTHNGAMLIDHYKDRNKVQELLNLGDISVLAPNVNPDPNKPHSFDYNERQEGVVVAYHRDRGEENVNAKVVSLDELFENTWIEFFYVFDLNGEWKYYDDYHPYELKDVRKELESEYKELGIKRPKNFYGYWTESALKEEKQKQQMEQE